MLSLYSLYCYFLLDDFFFQATIYNLKNHLTWLPSAADMRTDAIDSDDEIGVPDSVPAWPTWPHPASAATHQEIMKQFPLNRQRLVAIWKEYCAMDLLHRTPGGSVQYQDLDWLDNTDAMLLKVLPALYEHFEDTFVNHVCSCPGCQEMAVADGNAKINRQRCACAVPICLTEQEKAEIERGFPATKRGTL